MRKNKQELNLLNQARQLYCIASKNMGLNPINVDRDESGVNSRIISLRNREGECVQIRYTRRYLFIDIEGHSFFKKIVCPDQEFTFEYPPKFETSLFQSFKALAESKKLPLNAFHEFIISEYLGKNEAGPAEPEKI